MTWIPIKPENLGGGRQSKELKAKLYDTGQFTISLSAVALLGDPPRVAVQIDPDAQRIRLTPATRQELRIEQQQPPPAPPVRSWAMTDDDAGGDDFQWSQ